MFDYINMYDIDMPTETEFNFIIEGTDDLMHLMDCKRKRAGNKDLFSVDNAVYYNFYFHCDLEDNRFDIVGVCNHGEKDDWCEYILEVTSDDKRKFMLAMIKALAKELNKV